MAYYIAHHGVPHQKWGVRNGPPYPIEDKVLRKGTRRKSTIGVIYNQDKIKETNEKLTKINKKMKVNSALGMVPLIGVPFAIANLIEKKKFEKLTDQTQKELDEEAWKNIEELAETYKDRETVYTYDPEDEWDTKVYEGPFSLYNEQRGQSVLATVEYEVIDDMKLPTSKERKMEILNSAKENSLNGELEKDFSTVKQWYSKVPENILPDNYKKVLNYDTGKIQEKLSKNQKLTNEETAILEAAMGTMMEDPKTFKTSNTFLTSMAKKYDGMVDDHNVVVYNEAHDPLIIFNMDKISKISVDRLNANDVNKNYNFVKEELSKKGKNVTL